MKNRLIHPLWIHLPAVTACIYFIVRLIVDGPFSDNVPVHFNFQGQPDSYGSPWLSFGIFLVLSVFFIGLSIFLDELWARQEKVKTFNWMSLLDEIVVGWLVGISLGNIAFLKSGAESFSFPWVYLLSVTGIITVLAIFLEKYRPFRVSPLMITAPDVTAIENDLIKKWQENKALVYWESQNPLYISLLTIVLPLILLVSAAITWFSQPWAALVLFVVGLALIIPYGGLRTVVTRQDITVRFGLPGIRVLRLRLDDIASIELRDFSPLREFGGYGIRFNGQMSAYYMRGSRGVLLTLNNNKKYLIGSDRPEQLMAVLRVLSGKRAGK
jgi:hypothetical protein